MKLSAILLCIIVTVSGVVQATYLDDIGVTELQALNPSLTGSGIKIGIIEADEDGDPTNAPYRYQANPSLNLGTTFSYYDKSFAWGTAGATYNPAQSHSSHAHSVTSMILKTDDGIGLPGVATGISEAKMFQADHFIENLVFSAARPNIGVDIINQSFAFNLNAVQDSMSPADFENLYKTYIYNYDAYAKATGVLFVNGTPNSSQPRNLPAGMFNGIAAGVSSGNHNGPVHVVATVGQTSESTALISGAAALLMQAARDGSTNAINLSDADDARVIKSAILTGASKSSGWNQSSADPLDASVGAGILNVADSYKTLQGGQMQQALVASQAANSVDLTPTLDETKTVVTQAGWDLNTITTSTGSTDRVAHYLLDLSDPHTLDYEFTASLTWNSLTNSFATYGIKNLDLILVNLDTETIIAQSLSTLENVEYLYINGLLPGRYDLQVLLKDEPANYSETYAVSFLASALTVTMPEPSSACFILASGMALLFQRRRQHS